MFPTNAGAASKIVAKAGLKQAGGFRSASSWPGKKMRLAFVTSAALFIQAVLCQTDEHNSPKAFSVTFDNIRSDMTETAVICTKTLLYVACLIFLKSNLSSKAVHTFHIAFSFYTMC